MRHSHWNSRAGGLILPILRDRGRKSRDGPDPAVARGDHYMKKLCLLMMSVMLIALMQSCSPADDASKELRVAFVTNNASDFWTIAREGVEKADAELEDVSADFRITSDGTAADQKRIVDDLLAGGIQGIAISPVDPLNQTALLNDAAQKALVFTQDSDAPDSNRACYVGTDNVAAGRQAGELIKEVLPAGGKILLFVGKVDAQNARTHSGH
jgi:ribose transport system substrate-binding protein